MRHTDDRGIALVLAIMTMLLMTAMGAAIVLTTSTEALVSSNFRGGQQALYAADAALEWAAAELPTVAPDFETVIAGAVRSSFVDGAVGTRTLADGTTINLAAIAAAHPDWQIFAFGALAGLLPPSTVPSPFYVVVMVEAVADAVDELNVRAEAFGPRGAHKVVETVLSRSAGGIRPGSWRELR